MADSLYGRKTIAGSYSLPEFIEYERMHTAKIRRLDNTCCVALMDEMPVAFRMHLKIFRQRPGRVSGQIRYRTADLIQISHCNLQEMGHENLDFIVVKTVAR